MHALENPQTQETGTGGVGPGSRLQLARIALGLSLEQVAHHMHLSLSVVEAIEDNNFSEMSAAIFAKGYLRSYARIVALDADEIVQLYVAYYSDEEPLIHSTSNTATEISAADTGVKWATCGIIFIICALLAIWWWNQNQHRGDPVSLNAETVDIADAAAPGPTVSDEVVAESLADNGLAAEFASVDPLPTEVDVAVESRSGAATETTIRTEPPTVPRAQQTGIPPNLGDLSRGSDRLVLTVTADTWADIVDSDGYRLVYDLIRANRQLILTGQAPFQVFLGNGHGVELTYNSAAVDVSRHIRNDHTAKLQIGHN